MEKSEIKPYIHQKMGEQSPTSPSKRFKDHTCLICGKECYGTYCRDCYESNHYNNSSRRSQNKRKSLSKI